MTKRKRHWYARRTANDAPSYMDDKGWADGNAEENIHAAWAQGYNDAVQAYIDEIRETLRKEGGKWFE